MYLALARKYRPQRFSDLLGQTPTTRTLQNAIQMNKVYPALIFSGMKGVGKTSTARILAKALNCEKGPAIEPCNDCPTCLEITEDNAPDYLEIDGASNNGVEEVRRLRETVKYRPIKNRLRIVVIDEVHMLSTAAWNALLKTIEEPPEHTIFILATTDFHKIPATIVSRCQHFEFKRIPYDVIKNVLAEICQKEKIKISDYALFLIARSAEGSLRDAKKILDQSIAISSGDVKDTDVLEILGIIEEEIFIRLTQAVLSQDRKSIIEQIDRLNERGIDLRFFFNEFLKFIRDLMIIKSIEDSEKLHNLNPENLPVIRDTLKTISEVELLRYFNAIKEMEMTIKNTENPNIILELLFLKLSYFPALTPIEDLLKSQQIKSPVIHSPTATEVKEIIPPPPQAETEKETERLVVQFKNQIEKEKPRVASILNASTLSLKGDILVIVVPAKLESSWKLLQNNSDHLQKVVSELCQRSIQIELVLKEKASGDPTVQKIEELKKDKNINSLKEMLKGKLISFETNNGGENE